MRWRRSFPLNKGKFGSTQLYAVAHKEYSQPYEEVFFAVNSVLLEGERRCSEFSTKSIDQMNQHSP